MDRLLLLCLLLVTALCAQSRAKDVFLISHWCGPTEFTPESIAEVAEANFNVAMISAGSPEANLKALDLCQANGIMAMVIDRRTMAKHYRRDDDFESNLDAVVADYSGHPALWGYFVTDEPESLPKTGIYCLAFDAERCPRTYTIHHPVADLREPPATGQPDL